MAINRKRLKTAWKSPYNSKGKTNFPATGPGVYLIMKNGILRYVGYSGSNVYKALYRHFQTWNDVRERVVYKQLSDIKVRVIYCASAAYAAKLERALIVKHRPKDNPDKLKGFEFDEIQEKYIDEMDRIKARPIPEECPF